MGKAKFGVFGDGKELAQIALAKVFRRGDFRSGYYRDQTFVFALGEISLPQFFAQIYAHTDLEAEPASGGRMMNSHFGSRLIDYRTGEALRRLTTTTRAPISRLPPGKSPGRWVLPTPPNSTATTPTWPV